MGRLKQVVKRGLEYLPTWKTNTVLAVGGAIAVWLFGAPWWIIAVSYVLGTACTCVTFGWLDVANEDADAAQDDAPPPGEA